MNGKLMKMELDGNINNKENIEEIFEKKLEKIKQEFIILVKFIQLIIIKKTVNE